MVILNSQSLGTRGLPQFAGQEMPLPIRASNPIDSARFAYALGWLDGLAQWHRTARVGPAMSGLENKHVQHSAAVLRF